MTARKTSQLCEISSHYTCSDTNCNPIQQNTAPINGSRFVFAFLIVMMGLICVLALTACAGSPTSEGSQREEGKFPDVPAAMDQLRFWNEERFASSMLLTDEYGGGASSASDLAQAVDSEGCEILLLEDYNYKKGNLVLDIGFVTPAHEAQPVQRGTKTLKDEIKELPHFDFGYQEAISLLKRCGISKSSIKVYNDVYSKGLNVGELAQGSSARWGSMYEICGEAVTENGDPLFFSLASCANIALSDSTIIPLDSIELRFSKQEPFTLNSIFNKTSDSPIADEAAFELLAEY